MNSHQLKIAWKLAPDGYTPKGACQLHQAALFATDYATHSKPKMHLNCSGRHPADIRHPLTRSMAELRSPATQYSPETIVKGSHLSALAGLRDVRGVSNNSAAN